MKHAAPIDCVSLSDSLPSSKCRLGKEKQQRLETGPSKVVCCLDSDTESDGTYTHLGSSCAISNETVMVAVGKDSSNNEDSKQKVVSWCGLRKCSNVCSPNPPRTSEREDYLHHKGSSEPKKDAEATVLNSQQLAQLVMDNGPESPSSDRGLWSLMPSGSCEKEDRHDRRVSVYSDNGCTIASVSDRDDDLYNIKRSFLCNDEVIKDLKYLNNGSGAGTITVSSCLEKKDFCCVHIAEDHHKDVEGVNLDCSSSPSTSSYVKNGQKLKVTDDSKVLNASSRLVSSESDDSIPAWDDHLKVLINRVATSSFATTSFNLGKREQDFKPGSSDHKREPGGYSYLQKKPSVCKNDSSGSSGGGQSDDEDRRAGKRRKWASGGPQRTGNHSVNHDEALEKEAEKQRKMEERARKKEEKEAQKKKVQEEKELLKRKKENEKKQQQEARKKRNEEERRRKEELKADAAERRKIEREKEKWEKGKFALQSINALVDTRILEGGLIGGHLLTRFAEKGFKYQLVKNPITKTVLWHMSMPSKDSQNDLQNDPQSQDSNDGIKPMKQKTDSQAWFQNVDVNYIVVVLEAEEFLDLIVKENLDGHIKNIQKHYPGYTVCYLINKLMRHLQKREQKKYKNPGDTWVRPPVEQVLARLVTSYNAIHSRLCLDEAEVAEHIVGLTRSLAECPFKRKLTPLSLSANGDHVVKGDPNSDTIKKNLWLKALVAIPKVSGSCAIAIARKYPSMSALFKAYLDPSKTVYEKEHLLQDLMKEGLLGGESNKRVGPACSRRIYRILMAQQGNLQTDDVEEGADMFRA